jgi:hypothetical protein
LAFASESLSAYPISAPIRRTRSPCCANAERSGWEDPFCHRRPIEGVSAYEITKAVLEHIDELAAALAAAKGITPHERRSWVFDTFPCRRAALLQGESRYGAINSVRMSLVGRQLAIARAWLHDSCLRMAARPHGNE